MPDKDKPNTAENRNTFFDEVPDTVFEKKLESIEEYDKSENFSIEPESAQLTSEMLITLSLLTK